MPSPDQVDTRKLIADLRAIPRETKVEVRRGLRASAQPIVADARGRSSWSSRIPGAISVRTRLGAKEPGVDIRVDSRRAPHARPLENRGRPGNFRHPVFTREVWVAQRARPFLDPAVRAHAGQVFAGMEKAVQTAARRHGFH